MPDFMPTPKIHLKTKEDLINFLKNPDDLGFDKWNVKSDYIIDCIYEVEKSGKYPYNDLVEELARKEIKVDSNLFSTLVYNAQKYKRSDELTAAGYVPLWPVTLEKAYELGYRLQTESGKVCRVKRIGDNFYAIPSRCRNKCLIVDGQPVKFVN